MEPDVARITAKSPLRTIFITPQGHHPNHDSMTATTTLSPPHREVLLTMGPGHTKKKRVPDGTFWYLFRLVLPKIVTKQRTHLPPPPAL